MGSPKLNRISLAQLRHTVSAFRSPYSKTKWRKKIARTCQKELLQKEIFSAQKVKDKKDNKVVQLSALGRHFLRATACNASRVLAIAEVSVRPFVCPSHPWALSKRCRLRSWSFHCGLPQGLYSFSWQNFVPLSAVVLLEWGRQRGVPPRKSVILPLLARLVWKRLQIDTDMLLTITSTGHGLFIFVNIDDLERPWTPPKRGF